jgi:uncharacterized protein
MGDHSAAKGISSGRVEVAYRKAKPPTDPSARRRPFEPGTERLGAGSVHSKGGLPLPCDITVERDTAMPLRDGTTIYVDIFRPSGGADLPSVIGWGPYGKEGGSLALDDFPMRAGVPRGVVSGLQMFEGPDPAFWCAHGYAVVNADPRGVGYSEGDIAFWGAQEARDGYDLVEWVAQQPWSNGKVGLTGNSWLAILQWFIAAEHPPHLAAIAPWEGASDLYRDDLMRGGIPNPGFNDSIISGLSGQGYVEDTSAMAKAYPLMNSYWEDKAAPLEKIDVPAYVVASWTNHLHSRGTLEAFRRLASADKWLRVHNTMEWHDYYTPRYRDELLRFFDRYLRGLNNGWDAMPHVRLSVLDAGGTDDVDRPEDRWPPERFEPRKLYLDAGSSVLTDRLPLPTEQVRYRADDGDSAASFGYAFSRDVEIIGYPKLLLWVEAVGSNDMDLFVQLQKLSKRGRLLASQTMPLPNKVATLLARLASRLKLKQTGLLFFTGPAERLRVSHRELDPERSTPTEPFHTHTSEQPLSEGEIVPVEVGLGPIAMRFRAGEQLRVVIAGHDLVRFPVPGAPPVLRNTGEHVIHTGAERDSHLLIPVADAVG